MKFEQIFWVSFAFQLIGPLFKIMHLPIAEELLIIGIISHYLVAILAMLEIWQSAKIERNEKIMWTIAFLFLGGLVGLLYVFVGRKRIIS
jgi:threonine/homoserine/homoserine lactone efflux protein